MDEGEPRLDQEGQGFNRVDVMRSLESQVNQELDARHQLNRYVIDNTVQIPGKPGHSGTVCKAPGRCNTG